MTVYYLGSIYKRQRKPKEQSTMDNPKKLNGYFWLYAVNYQIVVLLVPVLSDGKKR
jgi:hypothetical protein